MGSYIAHHDGRFLQWSTVTDAPDTFGMPRAEFEAWYREEYGRRGSVDLAVRLERAVNFGTSDPFGGDLAGLASGNRAGPDEVELSLEDVIRFYFVERREPTAEDAIVPVPADADG